MAFTLENLSIMNGQGMTPMDYTLDSFVIIVLKTITHTEQIDILIQRMLGKGWMMIIKMAYKVKSKTWGEWYKKGLDSPDPNIPHIMSPVNVLNWEMAIENIKDTSLKNKAIELQQFSGDEFPANTPIIFEDKGGQGADELDINEMTNVLNEIGLQTFIIDSPEAVQQLDQVFIKKGDGDERD